MKRDSITFKGKAAHEAFKVLLETRQSEELRSIKLVLTLVDGYLSTQDQYLALAWDGGVMTYGELREHLKAALKTKVLNV